MAVVYQHRRVDTKEVFYVGIGKNIKRAYDKTCRSLYWNNYTAKYEYEVEITHRDIIWEEACSIEKYLIAFYGRRDLGKGNLVNMTDGGDGAVGRKDTEDQIKAKSERVTGNKNPFSRREIIEKIRLIKTGKPRLDMSGKNNITHRLDVKEKSKSSFRNFLNSIEGEMYKENLSKKMIGDNNPSKRPEISQKIKDSLKNRYSKLNQDDRNKSASFMNNKKITCEHCGMETNSGNYKRWHGTNCKIK